MTNHYTPRLIPTQAKSVPALPAAARQETTSSAPGGTGTGGAAGGEPYGKFWSLLEGKHGGHEAARVLAWVLGAVVDHGSQAVGEALEDALQADRCDLLPLSSCLQQARVTVDVPLALQGYQIEAVSPAEYDVLLAGGVR